MPEFKRQIIWIKEGLKLYEEIVKVRKILTKFLKILPDSLIFIQDKTNEEEDIISDNGNLKIIYQIFQKRFNL